MDAGKNTSKTTFANTLKATSMAPSGPQFNATEANHFLQERWTKTQQELNDPTLSENDKPKIYTAQVTGTKVWGQSKLHLQAAVGDFFAELNKALAKKPSAASK